MTAPDQELIAEVLLASEGFASPRPLARRLVSLFSLARGACSAQRHYDWGLRALKTALGAAGRLLREVGFAFFRVSSASVV
jgi:dynein heavy chain 2